MGLLNMFGRKREDIKVARSALEQARDPQADQGGAVGALVSKLLSVGIDGKGTIKSSRAVANKALQECNGDVEKAIKEVVTDHIKGGAAGGFATSLGGFVTMPISIPANVLEFYLQATRMTAAIAHLRGYDIEKKEIRSAVLLSLAGSDADDLLKKVGATTVTGPLVRRIAGMGLPPQALMLLNKAVGFQILRNVGAKSLAKLGKAIPILGGGIGAGMDAYMMNKIADHAREQFPTVDPSSNLGL